MTGEINLGDNYQIDEDSNGDLVIKDETGNNVLRWDNTNNEWNAEGNALSNLASVSTDKIDVGQLLSALDAAGYDLTNIGALDADSVDVGAKNYGKVDSSETLDVSTSAKTIHDFGYNGGGVVVVNGKEEETTSNRFTDMVFYRRLGAATVLASSEQDTPASRTYSVSGTELELSMSANTYNISTTTLFGEDSG